MSTIFDAPPYHVAIHIERTKDRYGEGYTTYLSTDRLDKGNQTGYAPVSKAEAVALAQALHDYARLVEMYAHNDNVGWPGMP